MSKSKKIIISVLITTVVIFIGGLFLLPDCDYYGGFQMFNPEARGKSCECIGLKIFYMNDAPSDGISASKCFGYSTRIK